MPDESARGPRQMGQSNDDDEEEEPEGEGGSWECAEDMSGVSWRVESAQPARLPIKRAHRWEIRMEPRHIFDFESLPCPCRQARINYERG